MSTSPSSSPDYPLPKGAYAAFDAQTIKQHIKDRLTQSGVFTDQNYEGSNLAAITDVIAMTFNMLLFYLNRTSTETMYSEAALYENMNRVVKMIDYKPVGYQTSTLSFKASATELEQGLYTIPRYASIKIGDISYSFTEDLTFVKSVDSVPEELSDLSAQKLLYQGKYIEHALHTATGEPNEHVYVATQTGVIDHFNIDVYVKENDDVWYKWSPTTSLFLIGATDRRFEYRLNENKRYELRFGNDINGRKLNAGESVAVYYLETLGSKGEVGIGALDGTAISTYNSPRFTEILADTAPDVQFLTNSDLRLLSFTNNAVSTTATSEESVEEIRNNAPGVFRSQYRLVSPNDYSSYIKTNFANLIHDVQVVNNLTYISTYMKYFYELGLSKPNAAAPVLHNQVQFSDSCNFNNVYIIIVPKHFSTSHANNSSLTAAQKEMIQSSLNSIKTLTSEVVILDPIYITTGLGLPAKGSATSTADVDYTELVVIKDESSKRDATSIREDVQTVFKNHFDKSAVKLGDSISISAITADILSINGVKTFYTQRTDDSSVQYEGLALVIWNPIYPQDITQVYKNQVLPFFKYGYFKNLDKISSKIRVISSEDQVHETVGY